MKRYIILISIIIWNTSCLKNNDSSTSAIYAPLEDKVYYYKLCKNECICKFQCNENTTISSIKLENVRQKCNELVAVTHKKVLYDYSKEIKEKIIIPLERANNLKAIIPITVDYDLLKVFDQAFMSMANISVPAYDNDINTCIDKEICDAYCLESAGTTINAWRLFKEDNEHMVYKNLTKKESGSILWSKLFKKMTYEEAKKTCEEYKANNYDDWSLPNPEYLKQGAISQLADPIKKHQNIELSFNDFVWSNTQNTDGSVLAFPLLTESYDVEKKDIPFQSSSPNKEHYVICTRQIPEKY